MCPKTAALIESIPGMATAMFSCLQPRTHIKPHIGYQQYSERILRCHLGIVVPKGCFLKVNWEDRTWEEGKCLVFDDTFRHEAWNSDPEHVRIVLMIDFFYGGKSIADGRNPDFVRQMEVEGTGQTDDAIISGDLLAAIQAFGAAQNITKGTDDRFS
jgi:aspartyl/asparaginyl beta-hydroxylase (cupin superfamily)